MADNNDPVFQIQRVYMKEASLEQPNSPAILLEQEQPNVDIQLGVEAQQAAEGMFEVAVTATVTTKVKDKTLFLVEVKQAGIFEIRNLPEDQMQAVLGIACPQIVYPYLRSNVSDVVTRAGFRRRGVSRALARAAVDFARERGARALEGYPMLTEPGKEITWGELHVGSHTIFAAAGFAEVNRPSKRRVVMRIEF